MHEYTSISKLKEGGLMYICASHEVCHNYDARGFPHNYGGTLGESASEFL